MAGISKKFKYKCKIVRFTYYDTEIFDNDKNIETCEPINITDVVNIDNKLYKVICKEFTQDFTILYIYEIRSIKSYFENS